MTVDAVRRLSEAERREITALAAFIRSHDALEVPLHLEEARSPQARGHFLVRHGASLAGFVSLDDSTRSARSS